MAAALFSFLKKRESKIGPLPFSSENELPTFLSFFFYVLSFFLSFFNKFFCPVITCFPYRQRSRPVGKHCASTPGWLTVLFINWNNLDMNTATFFFLIHFFFTHNGTLYRTFFLNKPSLPISFPSPLKSTQANETPTYSVDKPSL